MSKFTLGVLADTHIPDARRRLHPNIRPIFEHAGVQAILHAGDISIPRVLHQLETIAPTIAVRGNRDWFLSDDLPLRRIVEFAGIRIGMTHGHANLRTYIYDKMRYFLRGPRSFDYFSRQAESLLPEDVDVVVFGHNHDPLIRWIGSKLIFNPGSATYQILPGKAPTVGLLHIGGGRIQPEIVVLE